MKTHTPLAQGCYRHGRLAILEGAGRAIAFVFYVDMCIAETGREALRLPERRATGRIEV